MATIYNKNNMSTSEIKKMQQALVDKGYSVGSSGVDGIWGKDTAAALSKYKTDIGQNNSYGTTVGNSTLNQLYGKTSGKTSGSSSSIAPYTPTASKYDSEIAGYKSMIGDIDNAISDLGASYNNITNMIGSSANAQNAALNQAMGATADQINSLYDNSARDYYRLYKTQQKALPENLSRAGVTGGASESSQLKLMNAYSDNLYNNETARNNALAGNTADYQNKIAQNSIAMGNQLAGYYQNYMNNVAELNQKKAATSADLQQAIVNQNAAAAVDKWNANVSNRIQQQLDRPGGDTLWTYTTPDGKLHWTTDRSNAQALSSQYKLEELSSVTKKASSGSGSGSANTSKSTTTSPSYSYKTLEQNMTNALIKGATKEQLLTYVDPIEAAYNKGSITETETQKLLNMLK